MAAANPSLIDNAIPPRRELGVVREPARDVPVVAEVDVAVFGGGPAGVCAAVAAARAGRSVLLVERQGSFGGNATAAAVNHWHSLYGMDRQTKVIGGLAEECVRRLQREGHARNRDADGETGLWTIDTEHAKLMFDDLVLEAGAQVLLHTRLAGVLRDERQITAALIESKDGRGAVRAKTYIDCTGDADLIRRSGHPTQLGDGNGGCQPPTLVFRVGGLEPPTASTGEVARQTLGLTIPGAGKPYVSPMWWDAPPGSHREAQLSATRVPSVNVGDMRDLTRAEFEGRYQLRFAIDQLRRHKGWEDIYLVDIAATIGGRESYRAICDHMLTRDEVLYGQRFSDAIAQGTWPVDIHNPHGAGTSLYYLDGTTHHRGEDNIKRTGRWDGEPEDAPKRDTLCWQVPFGSLIPAELDNVLVAGRCIGAHRDAAGAIRVMVNCMQFGEAAGTAAALAGPHGRPRDIGRAALIEKLVANGFPRAGDPSARG